MITGIFFGISLIAAVFVVIAFLIGKYMSTAGHSVKTIEVINKKRKPSANEKYKAFVMDGVAVMFSEYEIERGAYRATQNMEDFPKI
jgi:hypothetical protein